MPANGKRASSATSEQPATIATVTLPFEKETKNTYRFAIPDTATDDEKAAALADIFYVKKSAFTGQPKSIKVTIEANY